MTSMKTILFVMVAALLIASLWNTVPLIKATVNFILNPIFGLILNLNLFWGLLVIILFINLAQTLIHKYTTDQEGLKKLKEEQKEFQQQMKQLKDQPEKMLELQKKQMGNLPKSLSLSMKSVVYTTIPLILFFRWFQDFFSFKENPTIFLGMGWIGTYVIFSIIFSMILKKVLKVQ